MGVEGGSPVPLTPPPPLDPCMILDDFLSITDQFQYIGEYNYTKVQQLNISCMSTFSHQVKQKLECILDTPCYFML